jgi:hypothetical protein
MHHREDRNQIKKSLSKPAPAFRQTCLASDSSGERTQLNEFFINIPQNVSASVAWKLFQINGTILTESETVPATGGDLTGRVV